MIPAPCILLFGGTSTERRVSVASAQNVLGLLGSPALLFIAPGGAVHRCTPEQLLRFERPFEQDFDAGVPAEWNSIEAALDAAPRDAVFFLALHGGDGENGTLQRALEARGLAFTGSGAEASANAFDKRLAKELVSRRGVRTPFGRVVQGDERTLLQELGGAREKHGLLVVKPVADGSSIGLHYVRDEADVSKVARAVAQSGQAYLVEEFVKGTELTVGVIEENGGWVPLPPSEVRVESGGMFDFAGKYLGRGTREITPAEVSPEVAQAAQEVAVAAHQAMGCFGYSRTDVIASATGIVFLEINTLPGLTKASFIPQQLEAAGRPIRGFIEQQLRLAMSRRAR